MKYYNLLESNSNENKRLVKQDVQNEMRSSLKIQTNELIPKHLSIRNTNYPATNAGTTTHAHI